MASEAVKKMQALVETTAVQMSPESEITIRPMFGGAGVFGRGRMFAAIIGDGLAIKLDQAGRDDLIAEGGVRWEMGPGQVSKQYLVVPDHLLAPDALQPWLERSLAYALSLPETPKRSRRRRQP